MNINATSKIIAIDGVTGYIGSYLLSHMDSNNIKIGCYDCKGPSIYGYKYISGENANLDYLNSLLSDVDVYYQMAAVSAVESEYSLAEQLLINSLGPYLASRINKNMTILTMSSIAVHDIERNPSIDAWIEKFITYFSKLDLRASKTELEMYLQSNPAPDLRINQYYGLSKLLLEELLRASSSTRNGKIFVLRSGLVIGANIHMRQGKCIVKSMIHAIYTGDIYEVWNRTNYFTPIHKLEKLMLYITNNQLIFAKYEVLDVGWVELSQHDFAEKLLFATHIKHNNVLKLVTYSKFDRQITFHKDPRLSDFYPIEQDLDVAIQDMTRNKAL